MVTTYQSLQPYPSRSTQSASFMHPPPQPQQTDVAERPPTAKESIEPHLGSQAETPTNPCELGYCVPD